MKTTRLILFHFLKMLLRPHCTESACQKSWCLPFLWAHLFQFPTPVLIWDYISQRRYINRQITMPLPESNLSAELCLKNKKPLQTVCAYRYIEPDAVFPVNGWDCETVFYCWMFSFLVMIMGRVLVPCFTIPLCKCQGWKLLRTHSGRHEYI